MTPIKDEFDEKVLDSSFEKIVKSKTEDMETHFVYASVYNNIFIYNRDLFFEDRLRSYILKRMKKNKIKKVMVTCIDMCRWRLITKETMENYCNEIGFPKESVNDDLSSLFKNIQLGKGLDDDFRGYFFPKLTKEELELVERKVYWFMYTFSFEMDADVLKSDMEASESDSKFVEGKGDRITFTIEN